MATSCISCYSVTISFNRGFHQPPVTDVIPEVRGTTGPLAAHFVVKWEGRWWSSFMVEPFPMKIGWHFLSWSETCALKFDGLSSNFPFFHGGYESPSREAGGWLFSGGVKRPFGGYTPFSYTPICHLNPVHDCGDVPESFHSLPADLDSEFTKTNKT